MRLVHVKWALRFLVAVMLLSFLVQSSTTVIRTTPTAKIFIDGDFRGVGSVVETNEKIVGTSTIIRIEEEGCRPQFHEIKRNERLSIKASFAGALVLLPLLWLYQYEPEHVYEYRCNPS